MADEWGPLGALVGDWESDLGGLDTAFWHEKEQVLGTPYLERLTFKPCGPVDNDNWLWDGATGEILRGFVVPRGITVLAGGTAAPDATSFTLSATAGDPQYSIGENRYLAQHASTLSYTVTITINDAGSWSYDETTMLQMDEIDGPFAHTDHNTLRKVG